MRTIKKIASLIIGLGIATIGFSQITFEKTFGGMVGEGARSIDVCSDGGYIITGATISFGAGGVDILAIKTDSLGNVQWTKTYGGAGDDYGNIIKQTTDGGFVIGGSTESFSGTDRRIYLVKTNDVGDTLWTKIMGSSSLDILTAVLITSNGDILVGGELGGNVTVIIKIDNNGNVLWSKTKIDGSSIHGLYELSNGDILIGGDSYNTYGARITRLDNTGNLIWSKALNNGGTLGFKELLNGDIISVIDRIIVNSTNKDIGFVRMNSAGVILSQKVIGTIDDDNTHSTVITTSGIVVVGSTKGFGQSQKASYMTHISDNGNVLWTKLYSSGIVSLLSEVQSTNDNGFVSAGTKIDKFYVIKTDSLGNTNCSDTSVAFFDSTFILSESTPLPPYLDSTLAEISGGVVNSQILTTDTTYCLDIYGCMDTSSINYNPNATIDNGSCIIDGLGKAQDFGNKIQIYPNPSDKNLTIDFTDFNYKIYDVTIYNTAGTPMNVSFEDLTEGKLYSRSKESTTSAYSADNNNLKGNTINRMKIDVAKLGKGNHIIVIETEKGKVTRSIIVN